jgi:hypothetical protein
MKIQLDTDELRTYERNNFFNQSKFRRSDPLIIILVVFITVLLSWFARVAFLEWETKRFVENVSQQMQAMNAQNLKHLEQIQMQAKVRAEQELEKARQQKLQEHLKVLDQQAMVEAQINERNNKAEAWQVFYQPSAECKNDDGKNFMKCANEHARAMKNFEAAWAKSH